MSKEAWSFAITFDTQEAPETTKLFFDRVKNSLADILPNAKIKECTMWFTHIEWDQGKAYINDAVEARVERIKEEMWVQLWYIMCSS